MERVLKEGHLMKAPDVSKYLYNPKKWHRKWFSLDHTGDLTIFDSDKSSKPSGILHMWQCALIFDPKTKSIPHHFCLGLEFGEYTTYLKADSAQVCNEWLRLFKKFADKCELEEQPERRGTFSDQFGSRTGSISSIQSLNPGVLSNLRRKEGLMAKTGSNNKGWRDRYFVLVQGKLSYYKSEKSVLNDAALGHVNMWEVSSVSKTSGKKGHGFDLHTPSRVYNFSVDTEEEMKEWVEELSHTIEVLSNSKGLSPTSNRDTEKRLSTGSDISGSSLDKILERSDDHKRVALSQGESSEDMKTRSGSQGDKDGVTQLLEAEVEALRSKVSSLAADLRSSSTVNSQLQEQLVTERRDREWEMRSLEQDKKDLATQVEQLEKAKVELETINDSIQTQLEEQQERTQELEEEQVVLKLELDEVQGTSNAFEEELGETQTRLQEIEEVARNLELALRKRSDSEPPDLSSLRSLNMSYKAKMTEELSNSLDIPRESLEEVQEASPEVMELRTRISVLETERDTLKQHMEELRPSTSSSSSVTSATPSFLEEGLRGTGDAAAERLVNEERLKWQVEVVNVRRELEEKLERERRGWKEKGEELKAELAKVKREVEEGRLSLQQVGKLQTELKVSQQRVGKLEGEVSSLSERVNELLVEKEKALADLKTIRKANKHMEKRLSENEVRPTSRTSMSSTGSFDITTTEERSTEGKIGELQARLTAVERERDALKKRVEELLAGLCQGTPADRVAVPSAATLNFFGKTSATVGTSGEAVSAQAQASPTTALRNGWTSSPADPNLPPPKPKKPPKELVDRYSLSTLSGNSTRGQPLSLEEGAGDTPTSIRSRTMSMFQTLFARR